MFCPQCGKEIRDDARFCPECGSNIEEVLSQTRDASAMQSQPQVPGGPLDNVERRKHRRRAVLITICVIFAAVVAGVAFSAIGASRAYTESRNPHPVTFIVDIDDYDDKSSRIPVQITGEDIDGNEVDKTIYLGYFGEVDVDLVKGTYHAKVVGSPITSKGKIYEVPDETLDFELSKDLAPEEEYITPASEAFKFVPVKADEVTDDEIEDAVNWARKDEFGTADVDALRDAAYKRRADAQAGIDVDFKVQLDTQPTGVF